MGDLTGSQIAEEVVANLGGSGIDGSDTRILRNINLAQRRLARAYDFSDLHVSIELDVTVQGDVTVDRFFEITNNIRDLFSIRVQYEDDTTKLVFVSTRQMDQLVPDSQEVGTGRPQHYTKWADKYELYPIPNSNYKLLIRASLWPTDLGESDVSLFNNKDDLIIDLATNMLLISRGQTEDAKPFWAMYQQGLTEAIEQDSTISDRANLPRGIREEGSMTSARPEADPFVKRIDS